jgi:uncharacterized protein
MTPQERQLVDDLFERLAKVDSAPRDPGAVAAIGQGLQRAPNALYALVQTVLLQDEALKRANTRIHELEAAGAPQTGQSGGFLDTMRETLFGQSQPRGSVPNVRPPESPSRPVWNSGQVMPQAGQVMPQAAQVMPQAGYGGQYDQGPSGQGAFGQGYRPSPFGGGGSFLGTAAAAAAGVVGGSLLLNGIQSMMGGHRQSFADTGAIGDRAASPWSDQSDSPLARDAGIDDIGQSGGRADGSSGLGLFDQASDDDQDNQDVADLDSDDFGNDGGDYA